MHLLCPTTNLMNIKKVSVDGVTTKQYSKQQVGKSTNTIEEANDAKLTQILMMVEPYVYPERMEEMATSVKETKFLSLDAAVDTIIDLGQGLDFDIVSSKLREKNLSGIGEIVVLNFVAIYAKNGPEFFISVCEKGGFEISDENMRILKQLMEENKRFAEQHGEKTDSGNYTI